ncbi:hypothetical protein ACU8V3_03815 [Cobetia marina]
MCGFGASLGIATALYRKLKTGRTSRIKTSLSALSGLAQLPFCYDYERRSLFDEPSGREATGYDDLARFYSASDGILLVSAYESELEKFRKVEGLEELPEIHVRSVPPTWHRVSSVQEPMTGSSDCRRRISPRPSVRTWRHCVPTTSIRLASGPG